MIALVLNCGSSSVKFQLIETDPVRIAKDTDRRLARGLIERIGSQSLITLHAEGAEAARSARALRNHREAVDHILRWIVSAESGIAGVKSIGGIDVVGHRVVHGGEAFRSSVRIDKKVLKGIEDCIQFAPLHNPANLSGIAAARDLLGDGVPQVAVFDTAFHTTMPATSYLYALPYSLYRRYKVRRYGFHGTSHRYLAYRYRKLTKREKKDVHIITLHLGNGASACAIKQGQSFDTSMGFTPLEGLVMGTRSGNIDASLVEYLEQQEGLSAHQVETLLNKQSGLLGVSGLTSDMRELLEEEREHGDRRAGLAIDLFCQRVKRFIGAYYAELGGADAVVFSGGIGENSAEVRARICAGLDALGLNLDAKRNRALKPGDAGKVSGKGSKLEAWVIPTDEELLIARDAVRCLS